MPLLLVALWCVAARRCASLRMPLFGVCRWPLGRAQRWRHRVRGAPDGARWGARRRRVRRPRENGIEKRRARDGMTKHLNLKLAVAKAIVFLLVGQGFSFFEVYFCLLGGGDHYINDHPAIAAAPIGVLGAAGELVLLLAHDLPLVRQEPNPSVAVIVGGVVLLVVGPAWIAVSVSTFFLVWLRAPRTATAANKRRAPPATDCDAVARVACVVHSLVRSPTRCTWRRTSLLSSSACATSRTPGASSSTATKCPAFSVRAST